MFAELALLSVTTITCSALAVANAIDKRISERELREALGSGRREPKEPTPSPAPPSKRPVDDSSVYVRPFRRIDALTPCPKCGQFGPNGGPELGVKCPDGELCPAAGKGHLHVRCTACRGTWLMKSAED